MKTWQEMALEYAAQGLRPYEVARRIEAELNLTGMYDKVYGYIKRHAGKTKEEPKERVVVQNHEPNHCDGGWK